MLKRKLSITLLLLAMLMFSTMLMLLPAARAEDGVVARVWTDKEDYAPGETVRIYGSGFISDASVTITVTRPDATIDEWAVASDSSGSFTTTYLLDGITGTYTVTATDGTNTATTTFTDAVKIKTYKDSGFTTEGNVFSRGDTVYAKATDLDIGKSYRIEWFNPSDVSVKATDYGTGSTERTDSYALPLNAPVGEWEVQVFEWKTTPSGHWEWKDTAKFSVRHLSLVSITASPTTIYLPTGTPITTTVSVTVVAEVPYQIQFGDANTYIKVWKAGTTTPVADLTITRTDATTLVTVDTSPYTYALTFTVTTTTATTYTGLVDVYARVDSRTPIPPGTPGPWLSHTTTATNVFTISTPPAFVSFKVSGVKENTEGALLDGWTIQLSKDGSPYASAVTGDGAWADGYYEFTITEPGDYSISEDLQAGWTRISPASDYTFTATSGHADITGQDFVNFEWLTI